MIAGWLRASIQRRVETFLTERGHLQVNAPTQDDYGANVQTSVAVESNVPVRILTAPGIRSNTAGLVGGAEALANIHRIAARRGTGLAVDQQWVVNGTTWQIVQIITDLTDDVFEMAVVERQR